MRKLKPSAGFLAAASFAALAFTNMGCGGGGGGVSKPGPVVAQNTGTFYSDPVSQLVGGSQLVNIGRGFVMINQGVPSQVGFELTADAVKNLPMPPIDTPAIYGIPLPPESVFTPFTYAAFSYWSGHPPAGIGEVPHFHPLFGIAPPQLPDPPTFPLETQAVAAEEIPAGHLPTTGPDAIAPGIGLAYQDPTQPQAQPGWDTIGQNYFFYKGHMNDLGLGATNHFLEQQEAGQQGALGAVINQPQVYPVPGYYPHHYTVSYDAGRKVHTFVLEDFQKAVNVRAQSRQ